MYPPIFISPNKHKIKIYCDGINIKVEQVSSETEKESPSIFYTDIKLRSTNKIIPYLLINKIESATEYKLSDLRDPKISSSLCHWDNDKFEITEIKLKFSGFNKCGGMIWEGMIL